MFFFFVDAGAATFRARAMPMTFSFAIPSSPQPERRHFEMALFIFAAMTPLYFAAHGYDAIFITDELEAFFPLMPASHDATMSATHAREPSYLLPRYLRCRHAPFHDMNIPFVIYFMLIAG